MRIGQSEGHNSQLVHPNVPSPYRLCQGWKNKLISSAMPICMYEKSYCYMYSKIWPKDQTGFLKVLWRELFVTCRIFRSTFWIYVRSSLESWIFLLFGIIFIFQQEVSRSIHWRQSSFVRIDLSPRNILHKIKLYEPTGKSFFVAVRKFMDRHFFSIFSF